MAKHDETYKFLFEFKEIVEQVILECFLEMGIPAHVRDGIKLPTLKPLPTHYVDAALKTLVGDYVWVVDYVTIRNGKPYRTKLHLPFEFQSTINKDMRYRISGYAYGLRESAKRRGDWHDGLPPLVLSSVIYCGEPPWPEGVGGLERFDNITMEHMLSDGHYFLLDMQRYALEQHKRDLIARWARMELARDPISGKVSIQDIYGILEGESMKGLRRAFYARARELELLWDEDGNVMSFGQLEDLYAGGNMEAVESNMRKHINQCVNEASAASLAKGREEGREEGQRQLLCRQATSKFDADTGERLAALLGTIGNPEHLETIADWIISCETPSELLSRCEGLAN